MTNTEEESIFQKIVEKKVPADLIYEDDKVVVIEDKYPKAPVHLLVLPKKHIPTMKEVSEQDQELVGHMIFVAKRMAEKYKCEGYRLQFNVGPKGGQVIFHLHLHLMGWK